MAKICSDHKSAYDGVRQTRIYMYVHVYVCYLKVCHSIKSVDGCGPFMAIASYVGSTC